MVVDSHYVCVGPFGVNRRSVVVCCPLGDVQTQTVTVPLFLSYSQGLRKGFLIPWYITFAIAIKRKLAFVSKWSVSIPLQGWAF